MFSIVGGLTQAGIVLVIICVMVSLWWSMFMSSSNPWDILGGLIILAMWGAGIYFGIKKGQKQAEEMGLR